MVKTHAHALRVLSRTRDFLARTQVTTLVGDLEGQRKELDEVIAQLSSQGDLSGTLTRASRAGTLTAHQLARRLRVVFIRPVVRAGRRMTGPEQEALRQLVMPKARGFEQLVSAGNQFAELVDRHKAQFVSAGLSSDAATKLRAAAAELLAAVSTRSAVVGQRVASVQGARATATAGRRLLRLIDALVRPALESDPAMAAEWQSLVRLGNRSGGGEAGEPVAQVTAAAGPLAEGLKAA
jgi:hypothetical protein